MDDNHGRGPWGRDMDAFCAEQQRKAAERDKEELAALRRERGEWFDKAQRFKERWNETLEYLDESWAERDAAREALRESLRYVEAHIMRYGISIEGAKACAMKARKVLGDD